MLAALAPAALAPQPLAVDQVCPGDLHLDAAVTQALYRLTIERRGGLTVAEQCARPCLNPERPFSVGSTPRLHEPVERQRRELAFARPDRRFDQLRHRPRGAITV